jgi:hypothetical protein
MEEQARISQQIDATTSFPELQQVLQRYPPSGNLALLALVQACGISKG